MTWDPEREGWSPLDPNRRCYTCGARPTHRYTDGSPGYRSCVHPPATATTEQMARWGLVPTNMRDYANRPKPKASR